MLRPSQKIETIHNFSAKGWAKAENGLIIFWHSMPKDVTGKDVELFDKWGRAITSLRVLGLVPDATTVAIYDVSARPGRIIAVSAVYASKERGVRPASALLIFDFRGSLLSFFAMAPWRHILRLEVDEDSNIWALNENAEQGKDPAESSMVTEYTTQGTVLKELLPRNLFPSHTDRIHGGGKVGFAAIGYDPTGMWFWLPGSTDLATALSGGQLVTTKTGLPNGDAKEYPVNLVRQGPENRLVAEFREGENPRPSYYWWSQSAKSWTRFKPGECDGGWLIGTDGNDQVYLRQAAATPSDTEICLSGTQ